MNKMQIWEGLKNLARQGIEQAFALLPKDGHGIPREDLAVKYVLEHVENVDQSLPVIGVYMDLPLVDLAEKVAVQQLTHIAFQALVRQQYAAYTLEQLAARSFPGPKETLPVERPIPAGQEGTA